jgi:enolase-phosphatase E1
MPSPDALARSNAPAISRTGMRVVLLDIEGTTCPVSFVSGTLFPYASQAMEGFLAREAQGQADVKRLLEGVAAAWRDDQHPEAIALRKRHPDDAAAYLRQLIDRDSKLPALKELQGLVWRAGYASGELVAPLFADVAPALRRWKAKGMELGVYSSGSVTAQQLLYRHSNAGDLSGLFSHWFDTRVGPKRESASYAAIARSVRCKANEVLFISDAVAECTAAQAAGMEVLFSSRDGNPQSDSCGFATVSNFSDLIILA